MDFWPIPIPKSLISQSKKSVRYADGKWTYVADTETGILIEVKCECGKVHKIKLGANLYCEPPTIDTEIIDVEEVDNEEPCE